MVEAGNAWIIRNKIQNNYDGIVIQYSVPLIENNKIINNLGNGITILKGTHCKIINNVILNNE